MQNRRLLLDSKHNFKVTTENIPRPREDEVVVKIAANGICGSDIHFYHDGRLGNFIVTDPYTPGHECSGTIVQKGCSSRGLATGDHVVVEPGIPCGRCDFCKIGRYNLCREVIFLSAPPVNGTFCDYISVRADMVHKIPAAMSFEQAALLEPAAVAVHAVNRARIKNGSTGVIVGAGPIGLLTLQAFKAAGGGQVICMDLYENRLKLAEKLGADKVINPSGYDGLLENMGDVVFETAGSSKTTGMLFKLAAQGGCVIQVGWPNGNMVDMNIADFLDKELEYIGVNRYANSFRTAITQIACGKIKVEDLITQRFKFDEAPEAFKFALDNPGQTIKVIVTND